MRVIATLMMVSNIIVAGIILLLSNNEVDASLVVIDDNDTANRHQLDDALIRGDSITATDPLIANQGESESNGVKQQTQETRDASSAIHQDHPEQHEKESQVVPNEQHQGDPHFEASSEDEDGDVVMKATQESEGDSCQDSQSLCGSLDAIVTDTESDTDETCFSKESSNGNTVVIVECEQKRLGVRECDPPQEADYDDEEGGSMGMSFSDVMAFIFIFISMVFLNTLLVKGMLCCMEYIDNRWISEEETATTTTTTTISEEETITTKS
ncbi:unnamed protein product [Cylindrotheca closterium]|uniref:Uncharacterized protein n=1 Tax=Cylindrotheca closterium TaxID=2856 RepID=A0AAD2PWB4_9STRA|nr:unnamed protein product [Cylindrotheca closterium]